jgi:hypothetical protein
MFVCGRLGAVADETDTDTVDSYSLRWPGNGKRNKQKQLAHNCIFGGSGD